MGQVQQHWPVRHTFVYIVLGQLYTLPSASTMRHLYKHCIVVTTSIYTLAQVQVQVHKYSVTCATFIHIVSCAPHLSIHARPSAIVCETYRASACTSGCGGGPTLAGNHLSNRDCKQGPRTTKIARTALVLIGPRALQCHECVLSQTTSGDKIEQSNCYWP